jgi:hypothetical protein
MDHSLSRATIEWASPPENWTARRRYALGLRISSKKLLLWIKNGVANGVCDGLSPGGRRVSGLCGGD